MVDDGDSGRAKVAMLGIFLSERIAGRFDVVAQ